MPRTPSPKVRIRSQSFDSPGSGGSRSSITPIEHYSPFSKSTGAIKTLTSYEAIKAVAEKVMRPLGVMLSPLNTKMSDDEEEEEEEESDIESSSSSNSSPSSSPTTTSFHSAVPSSRVSTSSASRRSNRRSHPLAETHSVSDTVEFEPTSPFLYQDTSFAMYSPWLSKNRLIAKLRVVRLVNAVGLHSEVVQTVPSGLLRVKAKLLVSLLASRISIHRVV
ncbi:hypothetical protein PTT_16317 [Pyrenophora teres f. teres 0-1]|uniref:Uncharacterized protein n=1 Tax=Pyrenophora teres f. teres (strain 0-1) TaxID=861557 RepID=E3S210_PYRTT|nr:hypothetical protein PTT_16317 [Pyrenophora teres f. teres 0-1]